MAAPSRSDFLLGRVGAAAIGIEVDVTDQSSAADWHPFSVVVVPDCSMKAISLWQPWASLWCCPRKVHETRHWRCSHRGWLLVHAAKRFETGFDPDGRLRTILDDEFGAHWAKDLPTGALIGMVNLVDCLTTQTLTGDSAASDDDRECGDFGPGRYGWKRDEFRRFDQPIPYRGRQGVFNVPADLILGYIGSLKCTAGC